MTLHIFNPEHDLALASGLSNFTAPHAGRQLRHDLGWLPALWADEEDEGRVVMVDDVESAQRAIRHRQVKSCLFVNRLTKSIPVSIDRVEPWGWNAALRAQLLRNGLSERLLPTEAQIDDIRQLSHRHTAARLLPDLQDERTVGEAFECTSEQAVDDLLQRYGQVVMKAPWSSSGRGVRFLSVDRHPLSLHAGWLRNTVERQGSVMVEPFYNKVKDFGMEFYADGEGHIAYQGLSLFHTQNGAYTGNIVATEKIKEEIINSYLPACLLKQTKENICRMMAPRLAGKYRGPFGVDMMVVEQRNQLLLHPCVEINLRRTMGHVAIALLRLLNPAADDDVRHVMRIAYANNNYKLTIKRL